MRILELLWTIFRIAFSSKLFAVHVMYITGTQKQQLDAEHCAIGVRMHQKSFSFNLTEETDGTLRNNVYECYDKFTTENIETLYKQCQ